MNKFCVVFPGSGEHYLGMGKDALINDKTISLYNKASDILGINCKSLLDSEKDMTDIVHFQLASFLYNLAVYIRFFDNCNVSPTYLTGLSLGQFPCLYLSRALDFENTLNLILSESKITEFLSRKNTTRMAYAYNVSYSEISETITMYGNNRVQLISQNSPVNYVYGGVKEDVLKVKKHLDEKCCTGYINVLPAVHTTYMKEWLHEYDNVLQQINVSCPKIPIISDVTGNLMTKQNVKNIMRQQLISCTHFQRSIEFILKKGINHFICVGIKRNLERFIKATAQKHGITVFIKNITI